MLLLAFRKPPSSYGLYGPALGSRLHCGRLINDKSPKSFLSANANANACQFGLLTLLRLVRRAWPARQWRQTERPRDRHTARRRFATCHISFHCVCFLGCFLLIFPLGFQKASMNESQIQPDSATNSHADKRKLPLRLLE